MEGRQKPHDLREACLIEGMAVIATEGVEKLSLREVARRLGVSHQAPYKHFASRDHILAEIVARAFADFARYLDAHPPTDDPDADLGKMGHSYLAYARNHPLEYRLMFGTPLPDPANHPGMMREAKHAFALLNQALKRRALLAGHDSSDDTVKFDALFIWAGLHGFASIAASSLVGALGFDPKILPASSEHLLRSFGRALGAAESQVSKTQQTRIAARPRHPRAARSRRGDAPNS